MVINDILGELKDWIIDNHLNVNYLNNENELKVENELYLLILAKDGKLFSDNFKIILTNEERELSKKFDNFLFSFGGKFFYTPVDDREFKLRLFKYRGKSLLENNTFIHLGIHGKYEILNGSRDYTDWIEKCSHFNQLSLGICETNTLAGVLKFQIACKSKDVKPILGESISIMDNGNLYLFKFYVINEIGWHNLLFINKNINSSVDKFIRVEELVRYNLEGLVSIIPLDYIYKDGTYIKNIEYFHYKPELLFLQLDSVKWENKEKDIEYLTSFKNYFNDDSKDRLPLILLNDSYYLDQEDWESKKILNKIGDIYYNNSKNQHYKSLEESYNILFSLFKTEDKKNKFDDLFEKAVEATKIVSEICNYSIPIGRRHLPRFNFNLLPTEYSKFESNEELFKHLVLTEFVKKYGIFKIDNPEKYKIYFERIKYELSVIHQGKIENYFLILWDIIRWCKTEEILTGIGRGSAAGSLISYLLDITKIDPIEYNLMFERFINPGRIEKSLPDIDVDFESDKRERVINYIKLKYGDNYLCSIGTFNTFQIKVGIKDLSKIRGLNYEQTNYLTKSMKINELRTGEFDELFNQAFTNDAFKKFINTNPDIIHLLYLILNQPKSTSIHPCATIILPAYDNDLFSYIPIRTEGDNLIAEWEGEELEKAGYLKEDILSLSQLDKISSTLKLIKNTTGENIDIYNIPTDDIEVFKLFQKGLTGDIFQFGSPGLTKYCKQVKPSTLEELIAMVALFRPGPIQAGAHNIFVSVKEGAKAEYDYGLEELTKSTSGLYIYQEQVMQACMILGGFSASETDDIRKAMGKKMESVLKPYEQKFIDGAEKNGCSIVEAEKIWNKLKYFSGYGFNRSHAACYALTGYITQWLKYHYPIQFWTSSFEKLKGTKEAEVNLNRFISEIKKMKKIDIITPEINKSEVEFISDFNTKKIYWSLSKIKFIGPVALEELFYDRETNGKYFSFKEFYARLGTTKYLDKRAILNLILSGCFDEIAEIQKESDRQYLVREFLIYSKLKKENEAIFKQEKYFNDNLFWLYKQREILGLGYIDYEYYFKQKLQQENIKLKDENMHIYIDGITINDYEAGGATKIYTGGIINKILVKSYKSKNNLNFGQKVEYCIVHIENNNNIIPIYYWKDNWLDNKSKIIGQEGNIMFLSGLIKGDYINDANCIHSENNSILKIISYESGEPTKE